MQNKEQKVNTFGQFVVESIGSKYIHAELLGSVKNYPAQLTRNSVVDDVAVGETIYLRIKDESVQTKYGTTLKFLPLKLLTDRAEIESLILEDRKRVADIFTKIAQEYLDNGWYSGDPITKALIFTASHPDLKQLNQQLRLKRLKNFLENCCKYKYKQTHKFFALSNSALEMFNEEKSIGELDLSELVKKVYSLKAQLRKNAPLLEKRDEAKKNELQELLNMVGKQ